MTCPALRHGTDDAYANASCRCPDARQEHLVARKRRELRLITSGPVRVDATGTARRLQALAAVGYGLHDLAPRLDVDSGYLGHLRRPTRPRVLRSTAYAVRRMYDALAETTGPSAKACHHADREGWLPPKWWDADDMDDPTFTPSTSPSRSADDLDLIAVERAMRGERLRLTRRERLLAVELLAAHRLPRQEIARRLGMHGRQVYRDLTELQLRPTADAIGPDTQTRTTA